MRALLHPASGLFDLDSAAVGVAHHEGSAPRVLAYFAGVEWGELRVGFFEAGYRETESDVVGAIVWGGGVDLEDADGVSSWA
jgi:hypothetical protein